MAQTGYTPIQIYSSSTGGNTPAAGSLTNSTLGSELAINITDGKLFYKDNANAVQVIGWKTTPTTAGGTGLTSYTAGDLLYYASGTTLSKLAIGTSGQWLGSSGTAPQWNSPAALTKTDDTNVTLTLGGSASTALLNAASLTLGWTGQLAASRGGTGIGTYTAGDLLYASGTTTLSKLAIGTANYVLTSSGSAPQWTAGSSVSVGTASNLLSNATSGVMQIVGPAASTTRVMTIPNANFTAARTDAAQTFTGTQVFSSLPQITAATANRILYADGSQVMATSTYMQFDGTKVQFGQGTFSVGDNDVGLTVTSGQRTNLKVVSTESGGNTWTFQTAGTGNYGSGNGSLYLISSTAGAKVYFQNSTLNIGGMQSGAAKALYVIGGSNTSSDYAILSYNSDSSKAFFFRNDGYAGATYWYATTTGSAANVYVDSAGALLRSTSALKYKQDVRDLEDVDINIFRPVRYKSKCESDDQTIDRFGFIADEADAAGAKELVTYGPDGQVESFQYERMTVVLTKRIQMLEAKLKAAGVAGF